MPRDILHGCPDSSEGLGHTGRDERDELVEPGDRSTDAHADVKMPSEKLSADTGDTRNFT